MLKTTFRKELRPERERKCWLVSELLKQFRRTETTSTSTHWRRQDPSPHFLAVWSGSRLFKRSEPVQNETRSETLRESYQTENWRVKASQKVLAWPASPWVGIFQTAARFRQLPPYFSPYVVTEQNIQIFKKKYNNLHTVGDQDKALDTVSGKADTDPGLISMWIQIQAWTKLCTHKIKYQWKWRCIKI